MASERKIVADNLKRVLLKEFVMRETARAGFGGLDIQRTPMGTRITLFAERPGIVIGRRGASIKELTANVDRGFGLDNPQIEVEEVGNPALNAQIMAEKLASALERGWHFRRAGHSTLRRIMASGAKGALIRLSGKLTSQRHRTEKFKAGHIKFNGEPKNLFVDQGFSTAHLKRGSLGVTVWITDPNAKLPDEIEVVAPETPAEVPVPEVVAPAEEPTEAQPEESGAEPKTEEPAPPEPAVTEPPEEGEPVGEPEEPVAPEPAAAPLEGTATEAAEKPAEAEPEEKPTKPAPAGGKAKAAPKKTPAKKPPKEKAGARKKKTPAAAKKTGKAKKTEKPKKAKEAK